VVGFATVTAPVAAVLLLIVPIDSLVEQLVWYPVVGPRQFRSVPGLGVLFTPEAASLLSLPLVWLPRIAIIGALFHGWRTKRRDVLAVAIFAALCQLQTLGRTDIDHLAMAAIPALPLLGIWIQARRLTSNVGLAVIVGLCVVAVGFGRGLRASAPPDLDPDLWAAAEVTRSITSPGDPIFVGLTNNRYMLMNPLLAYFLADRTPGTTTTMYNPGVTTTEARQREMTSQLDRSGTDVAILNREWADLFEAWNDSRFPGPTVLDDYLARSFRPLCDFGTVQVHVRRGAAAMPPTCPRSIMP
jgi:hypothetical protein